MLNNHLRKQLESSNYNLLPNNLKDDILSEFKLMSYLNIDNDKDQHTFFIIKKHVPEILFFIFNNKLNDKIVKLLSVEIYKNLDIRPIGTLLELIEAVNFALNKLLPKSIQQKTAFPQPEYIQMRETYNINKWVDATRQIYYYMEKGYTKQQAEDLTINKWEPSEKMDYKQWLRFYQERVPEKYTKLANGTLPMYLFKDKNLENTPLVHAPNQQPITKSVGIVQHLPNSDVSDARDKIERQRQKLVARLNAAEKLLYSLDGQLFAGEDQELMLKLLQDLKRKIQTANKLTVNSSLFEDKIFCTANSLQKQGKNKVAGFFYKLAQTPDLTGLMGDSALGLPVETPIEATKDSDSKTQTHDLLKEFFDGLKGNRPLDKDDTIEERKAKEKIPEVIEEKVPETTNEKAPATAEDNSDSVIKIGSGYWRSKTAQAVPPVSQVAPPVATNIPEEVIPEVSADVDEEDNTDDVIEAALKHVTINDVITRLEMLVSIYNQREISRQLSILDIMMDRIGIASFFPSLGEAMSKALDANQYIGNRLEEILTKLKGSLNMPKASEWIEVRNPVVPESSTIQDQLKKQQESEDRLRNLRRQKEVAKLEGKPIPKIEEVSDLQKPIPVIEQSPKTPVR